MTVCYGHQWSTSRSRRCARCGHDYWEHSHFETLLEGGRVRRSIIAYGGTPYRTVYDRMMDRTIGVCDWYKLRAAQEVEKQADALLVYHEAAAGDHAATIRAVAKNEMFEVTTFHDLALRQRRYVMSNGITQVVVPIPEEEP